MFQKDAFRMISDDLKLSDPVPIEFEGEAWFPFMNNGLVFMRNLGTCYIFNKNGQLMSKVEAIVLIPESERVQFLQLDSKTQTI